MICKQKELEMFNYRNIVITAGTAVKNTKNIRKGTLTQKEMRKMMKKITLIMIAALAILMAGCSTTRQAESSNHLSIQGSGNLVSRQLDFGDFDRIDIGLSFGLTIRHGNDFSVTLTADDNFIDYILVAQEGSTLRVGFKPGYAYDVNGVSMQLEVTMPDLAGLNLGEASHTYLADARSSGLFAANLSGSSLLEGNLLAKEVRFELSGNTHLELAGSADTLQLDSCGNSLANLEKFTVVDASLAVSCNSITSLMVTGKLEVDASQFAQVFNHGQPVSANNSIFQTASLENHTSSPARSKSGS
jgi:hypothetical protein